jgi:hypothetical protein
MANFYAVQYPTFQRAMRNILSITQAFPAVITTTFDGVNPGAHDYATGLIARIDIPLGFGMEQANEFLAPITVTSPSTFTMPIDTRNFDAFAIPLFGPPGKFGTPAQVVPVGQINELLTMATVNVLPYP